MSTENNQTPPAAQQPVATPVPTTPPTPTPAATEWAPYVVDATKSAQENLVLKDAHDKTAPAGHDVTKPFEAKPAPAVEPPKPAETPAALQLTDLVAPEGFQIDPGLGTELITIINQSRNDPKALVNSLLALQAKANSQNVESESKQWDNVLKEWTKQTEADPEIGGAKYAANKAAVTNVVAKFGGPKMQEALELTGMGSHPEFMRFVSKLAPFLAEAAPVSSGTPTPQGKKATSTNLYPNQP